MNMVMSTAERVVVLDFGKKIAEGSPDEVQRDPKVVEAYLANLSEGATVYDLSTLLQFLIGGISLGCIYGLVGIGYSVLYNSSGIINFAQGGFVMLGGMLTYIFTRWSAFRSCSRCSPPLCW